MTPGKQHLHILLLLIVSSYSTIDVASAAKHNTTVPCLPGQASSLLQLKRSFIDVNENLASWRAGSDCCHWKGVTCDMASGRIISLDLGEFHLTSRRLDPAVFNLTSLRNLSLSYNDFGNAKLPSYGFEQLKDMIHLNFSDTNFFGQIPIGISHIKNLVTLDFSDNNFQLYLKEPNFRTFMSNLSNLRDLRLDGVKISDGGSTWSIVLADSVPQLQILSLDSCDISGPIHPSFSRLRSLREINLRYNELTGKVPEFFAEFSSLRILDLAGNYFEGSFPTKIFQLQGLRTLDLFETQQLSVCLPDFPIGGNLETLSLAGSTLSCGIPRSFTNLKYLKTLGISTTGISKGISSISKLQSLNELQLYGGDLKKPVLSWIGNLTRLTSLELVGYDFSGSAFSWIGSLLSLERLVFGGCNSSRPIPYQIGNLTNLITFEVEGWRSIGQPFPPWIGNLTKLVELGLQGCNFSSPIPSTIGNLMQLEVIQIGYNNLTGAIPKSLFALPALRILYMNSNQLCGPLEDIPDPLSSPLSYIDLISNQLTGPIPKSIYQLKHLELLYLGSNRLSGTLELSSFWRLRTLTWLSLSDNMLSVVLDEEGDNALLPPPNINSLYLESCNLTKFPGQLRYLDRVSDLDLSNNKMKGVIPSWVWVNWKDHLQRLDLSHNMFTTLEKSPSLVHMPHLYVLDLSFNRLQGSIPIPVSSFPGIVLDYSNNNFSSIVPDFGKYIKNFTYLNLSMNKLSGLVPSSICSASELSIIDLSYNNFNGSVPSCLIENGKCSVLRLRQNKFRWIMPENIREGCKLETIDLNGNQIEGKLPRSLSNCQDLELLDIGNNQIVGSFPFWLGILPKLRVLVLRSNQLNGTICDNKGDHHIRNHFSSLQILDLASNNFSGNLPKGWFDELTAMIANVNDGAQVLEHSKGSSNGFYHDTITLTFKGGELTFTKILSAFNVIDFSNNSFGGHIPESLMRLVSLHGLNMSYNNFMGPIPSQLSKLSRLESLDLSWNQLSGEIPRDLTSLTSLEWLNLSYNNLSGRIPQGNQFLTFSNSSFEGNMGLCGLPLSKQCDTPASIAPSAVSPHESNSLWQDKLGVILLFTFVGLGFGVGFALSLVLRLRWRIEGWLCKL